MTTQSQQILNFLMTGGKITPLEALDMFNCLRLGARCFDLKRDGIPIQSEMIKTNSGKRVAQYFLPADYIKNRA